MDEFPTERNTAASSGTTAAFTDLGVRETRVRPLLRSVGFVCA